VACPARSARLGAARGCRISDVTGGFFIAGDFRGRGWLFGSLFYDRELFQFLRRPIGLGDPNSPVPATGALEDGSRTLSGDIELGWTGVTGNLHEIPVVLRAGEHRVAAGRGSGDTTIGYGTRVAAKRGAASP